ncbi:hypothetical protein C8R43DRAFT_1201845 [Mycena crocata]|nr:hypothetical protein C8R43DRAFT_1201845 [Mycena crocata]
MDGLPDVLKILDGPEKLSLPLKTAFHEKAAAQDELGFELWSRVWPWANFIYTYKDHLPGQPLPEATFCIEFLIYTTRFQTNHEAMPFVCDSAGFKSLLTAAWGFLLDVEDPETRDFGLSQVSTLLPGMKPGIDTNLEEMIDAAGSVDHLALLIINHTQATLDMAKKPMTVTDVYFIRAILDFVVEAEHLGIPGQQMYEDSLGKLGTSLARHNFAQVLVVAARRLGETGDNTKLITGTLERCLLFLARVFIIPSGQRRLPSAISEGLLCALICAGHFDGLIQNHFSLFFGGILPLCLTSYYAVAALQYGGPDALLFPRKKIEVRAKF